MQKDSMKDMRSRNLRNIAFITILVIVALLVIQTWRGATTDDKEANYSEFRALVERGQIREVVIRDGSARATTVSGDALLVRLPDDPAMYQDLVNQAPGDYIGAFGTITFDPGTQAQTVAVTTLSDSNYDPGETFALTLSSPTAATLGNAVATGTILDTSVSDPTATPGSAAAGDRGSGAAPQPTILVRDAIPVIEGGTVQFSIVLSQPSQETITVRYGT